MQGASLFHSHMDSTLASCQYVMHHGGGDSLLKLWSWKCRFLELGNGEWGIPVKDSTTPFKLHFLLFLTLWFYQTSSLRLIGICACDIPECSYHDAFFFLQNMYLPISLFIHLLHCKCKDESVNKTAEEGRIAFLEWKTSS